MLSLLLLLLLVVVAGIVARGWCWGMGQWWGRKEEELVVVMEGRQEGTTQACGREE